MVDRSANRDEQTTDREQESTAEDQQAIVGRVLAVLRGRGISCTPIVYEDNPDTGRS